jgi:hypothetical protein
MNNGLGGTARGYSHRRGAQWTKTHRRRARWPNAFSLLLHELAQQIRQSTGRIRELFKNSEMIVATDFFEEAR